MSKKTEEAKAMLSAAEADTSSTADAVPLPLKGKAKRGAAEDNGAEILRCAQNDESLEQAVEEKETLPAGSDTSSTADAVPLPLKGKAKRGAAEDDGAEILRCAQDDESLAQGEGSGTLDGFGKVKLIVNKPMTVPEIKDGRVQLRAAYGGTVYSGSRREFGTGVFAELPAGCIGFIVPEKRLKENSGLLCTDIRYSWEEGEIAVTLHNVGIRNCDIQPGQLIAEMIIVPVLDAEVALDAEEE